MGDEGFKCGSWHGDISSAAAAWPKSSVRPSLIHKMGPTNIVNTLLTRMRDLNWAGGDDVQPEIITAILKVMIVTDPLHRGAADGAGRNRAERHESELDARAPGAVVYHIRLQNLLCKLLLERGEPLPFGQHLGGDTQKARWRW